jgi:RNA polymerase sigma-54 factor
MKIIQQTMHFISENLVPFPARAHYGDTRDPSKKVGEVYHRPDIIISYLNDNPEKALVVEIVMPISGTLRINPMFREAIHEAGTEEQKESWKAYLERAELFIKCLQQRNHTMERLMRRLVNLQHDFILKGEKYLVPVTRFQISTELEVHESTISRAVAGKAVQLPNRRIIPLSSFFDRSLPARMVLKELIDDEPYPLSDAELMGMLAERGFPVARRTVAKYRALEGILPAQMRKPILREI